MSRELIALSARAGVSGSLPGTLKVGNSYGIDTEVFDYTPTYQGERMLRLHRYGSHRAPHK